MRCDNELKLEVLVLVVGSVVNELRLRLGSSHIGLIGSLELLGPLESLGFLESAKS